ncbi:MAG: hypothetical protein ACRCSN_22595 [Dermatophilaceae bacterium]
MIDVEMVIPEGWMQFPTVPGTERERARVIEGLVEEHLPDSLPRDSAEPWRRELRKRLEEATAEASRQGARSVLLPVRRYGDVLLPGSLLLTVLQDDPDTDAEQLLSSLLAEAGDKGTYLEIGGAPSVRIAAAIDSKSIGRKEPSLRVSYYVSNPEEPGYWALLTFSVLSGGDVEAAPVQAVVMLFDAVVGSLRWCVHQPA